MRGDGAQAFCAGYDLTSLGEPEGRRAPRRPPARGARPARAAPAAVDRARHRRGVRRRLRSRRRLRLPDRLGAGRSSACLRRSSGWSTPRAGSPGCSARSAPRARSGCSSPAARSTRERALEWGLLDELYPTAAEADAAARALAEELCANAPLAVQGMKRGLGFIARRQLGPEQRAQHRAARLRAYLSADAKEGKASFAEKRSPDVPRRVARRRRRAPPSAAGARRRSCRASEIDADDSARSICESSETESPVRRASCFRVSSWFLRASRITRPIARWRSASGSCERPFFCERVLHRAEERLGLERLLHVVGRLRLQRGDRGLDRRVGGRDDHREVRVVLADLREHLGARAAAASSCRGRRGGTRSPSPARAPSSGRCRW